VHVDSNMTFAFAVEKLKDVVGTSFGLKKQKKALGYVVGEIKVDMTSFNPDDIASMSVLKGSTVCFKLT
jgi:hypothetical protein